jgi:hypothetical protein
MVFINFINISNSKIDPINKNFLIFYGAVKEIS